MRVFLGRTLTWLRWKALVLLVLGTATTQLDNGKPEEAKGGSYGYMLVLFNARASSAGGVISEKLLKGNDVAVVENIHWQNIQLYFFGLLFGLLASGASQMPMNVSSGHFTWFNGWAYATVLSLAIGGLLV